MAAAKQPLPFLLLFLVLAATDWLDGKLAAWFDQRSTLGSRLDSLADAAMYGALLVGAGWLKADRVGGEYGWIAAALLVYVLSCTLALAKFGRLPSYHTRTAKFAWLLTVTAAVVLLLDGPVWPLRVAMLAVLIANLDAILVTVLLRRCETDVASFPQALRNRQREA